MKAVLAYGFVLTPEDIYNDFDGYDNFFDNCLPKFSVIDEAGIDYATHGDDYTHVVFYIKDTAKETGYEEFPDAVFLGDYNEKEMHINLFEFYRKIKGYEYIMESPVTKWMVFITEE